MKSTKGNLVSWAMKVAETEVINKRKNELEKESQELQSENSVKGKEATDLTSDLSKNHSTKNLQNPDNEVLKPEIKSPIAQPLKEQLLNEQNKSTPKSETSPVDLDQSQLKLSLKLSPFDSSIIEDCDLREAEKLDKIDIKQILHQHNTPQIGMLKFEIPHSPLSAQQMSEILTPMTSPSPANRSSQNTTQNKYSINSSDALIKYPDDSPDKYQSTFSTSSKKTTCEECFMSYMSNLKEDKDLHGKYHVRYLDGLLWGESWGTKVAKMYPAKLRLRETSPIQRQGYICQVNMSNHNENKTILSLLNMINNELNAPDDWYSTAQAQGKAATNGKIFVYIYNRKIIGLLSYEKLDPESPTCLMDVDGQNVVVLNSKKNSALLKKLPKAIYGVSRIFILKKYRRGGIALVLLHSTLGRLVYGLAASKYQVSWSQPSSAGLKLAESFNLITDTRSKRKYLNVYIEGT